MALEKSDAVKELVGIHDLQEVQKTLAETMAHSAMPERLQKTSIAARFAPRICPCDDAECYVGMREIAGSEPAGSEHPEDDRSACTRRPICSNGQGTKICAFTRPK